MFGKNKVFDQNVFGHSIFGVQLETRPPEIFGRKKQTQNERLQANILNEIIF